MNRFQPYTTGTFEIAFGEGTADAKLHFSTELVASVILRTARKQEHPSEADMNDYIHLIVDDVTDGWKHAVNAVHVVIAEYWRRVSGRPGSGTGLQDLARQRTFVTLRMLL